MRKGLAGLILGLSLVVASVSWAGFVLSRTVLDPGRSERLADQVFDNQELRSVLVSRLADGIGASLPGELPVPAETLELAADVALNNPAVQALVRDSIVETHRAALEGSVEPVLLDGQVLAQALRDALVQARPELDAALPQAPEVSVELPTSGLNVLGTLKNVVDRFTLLTATIAIIGGATALLVTNDRPSVLRRVAFWAFGAALFWFVVGVGVPRAAGLVGPTSSALVTALIDVFFGAMIRPAIIMGVVGAGLLVVSLLWSSLSVRRPANVAQPVRVPRGQGPKVAAVRLSNSQPGPRQVPIQPVAQPQVDRTTVQPSPTIAPEPDSLWAEPDMPAAADKPNSPPRQPGWVEGIGYVEGEGPEGGGQIRRQAES